MRLLFTVTVAHATRTNSDLELKTVTGSDVVYLFTIIPSVYCQAVNRFVISG